MSCKKNSAVAELAFRAFDLGKNVGGPVATIVIAKVNLILMRQSISIFDLFRES